jgi:hypothetical protein
MANLMEGYLRVIGEKDAHRREQIWPVLANTESSLVSQFQRFADEFATLPAEQTRASTLPLALPYMTRVLPSATMDVRETMKLHAQALAAARVGDAADEEERKRRAFTMTAELMLMQHTATGSAAAAPLPPCACWRVTRRLMSKCCSRSPRHPQSLCKAGEGQQLRSFRAQGRLGFGEVSRLDPAIVDVNNGFHEKPVEHIGAAASKTSCDGIGRTSIGRAHRV